MFASARYSEIDRRRRKARTVDKFQGWNKDELSDWPLTLAVGNNSVVNPSTEGYPCYKENLMKKLFAALALAFSAPSIMPREGGGGVQPTPAPDNFTPEQRNAFNKYQASIAGAYVEAREHGISEQQLDEVLLGVTSCGDEYGEETVGLMKHQLENNGFPWDADALPPREPIEPIAVPPAPSPSSSKARNPARMHQIEPIYSSKQASAA